MTNLTAAGPPVPDLAERLRRWAQGYLPVLTAVELLIAHDRWLARPDFVTSCVDVFDGYDYLDGVAPMACVQWDDVPRFLQDWSGTYSPGMGRVLGLACELAGVGTGTGPIEGEDVGEPLEELSFSLDDADTALVSHAVARAASWVDAAEGHSRSRSTHTRRVRRCVTS
jgi:hypothetical protein